MQYLLNEHFLDVFQSLQRFYCVKYFLNKTAVKEIVLPQAVLGND